MSLAKMLQSFRMWRTYRDNVYELEQLSDRQLADVGLTRDSIYAVARNAASKSVDRAEAGSFSRLNARST